MQSTLLLLLASLPLAQLLLGRAVLRAPIARPAVDVSRLVVGPEALRSMASRAQHRSALVRRAQRRFDPGRGNWRRSAP